MDRLTVEKALEQQRLRIVIGGAPDRTAMKVGRTKIRWKDRYWWEIKVRAAGNLYVLTHEWVYGRDFYIEGYTDPDVLEFEQALREAQGMDATGG